MAKSNEDKKGEQRSRGGSNQAGSNRAGEARRKDKRSAGSREHDNEDKKGRVEQVAETNMRKITPTPTM